MVSQESVDDLVRILNPYLRAEFAKPSNSSLTTAVSTWARDAAVARQLDQHAAELTESLRAEASVAAASKAPKAAASKAPKGTRSARVARRSKPGVAGAKVPASATADARKIGFRLAELFPDKSYAECFSWFSRSYRNKDRKALKLRLQFKTKAKQGGNVEVPASLRLSIGPIVGRGRRPREPVDEEVAGAPQFVVADAGAALDSSSSDSSSDEDGSQQGGSDNSSSNGSQSS